MADEVILVDTSILIEFYRKTDKANSRWVALVRQGFRFATSVVTKYEIYTGATPAQLQFWNTVFQAMEIIPFDEAAVDQAALINAELKKKRKQIDLADLFIAATALARQLPLATLNTRHFSRIEHLVLI